MRLDNDCVLISTWNLQKSKPIALLENKKRLLRRNPSKALILTWGERPGLNRRPSGPQPDALTS